MSGYYIQYVDPQGQVRKQQLLDIRVSEHNNSSFRTIDCSFRLGLKEFLISCGAECIITGGGPPYGSVSIELLVMSVNSTYLEKNIQDVMVTGVERSSPYEQESFFVD